MNVPDLARRAALSEQQKAQAQAADMGLWLKIAVEWYVANVGAKLSGDDEDRRLTAEARAEDACIVADAFMAEYKKRREDASLS